MDTAQLGSNALTLLIVLAIFLLMYSNIVHKTIPEVLKDFIEMIKGK